MAYTIQMNEYQRALILETLLAGKDLPQLGLDRHPGMAKLPEDETTFLGPFAAGEETALQELEIIIELLGELPEVEKTDPGVLHSFCL